MKRNFSKLTILFFAVFLSLSAQTFAENPIRKIHIRGQVGKAKIDTLQKTIFVTVNYYGKNGIYPLSHAFVETFSVKDSLTENLLTRKEDSDVNKVVIRQITETIKKEGGMKTMIPAQFVDNISGLHER